MCTPPAASVPLPTARNPRLRLLRGAPPALSGFRDLGLTIAGAQKAVTMNTFFLALGAASTAVLSHVDTTYVCAALSDPASYWWYMVRAQSTNAIGTMAAAALPIMNVHRRTFALAVVVARAPLLPWGAPASSIHTGPWVPASAGGALLVYLSRLTANHSISVAGHLLPQLS